MAVGHLEFTWWSLITVALGSGLTSVLLGQGLAWFIRRRDEKKEAKKRASFLAITIATALERFAMDCATVAQDVSNHQSSGGAMGKIGGLPPLVEYPSNLDWPSFDTSFCNRVLSLRHELELSRLSIDFAFEMEGHMADGDETKAQALKMGLRAWRLAEELRQHYDLPALPLTDIWDFPKYLREETSRVEAQRNKPDVCLE